MRYGENVAAVIDYITKRPNRGGYIGLDMTDSPFGVIYVSRQSEATEFEKLIVSLHQAILNAEGYDNIRVEHNVTLPCKSGATAQFDVYWKFKQAGITHEVAIECKNYNHTVAINHIRDFAYKLHDAGNIRGVMVTRVGYQEGTKQIAKANGINLKKFQFPDEMDWNGRMRIIKAKIRVLFIENLRRAYDFDRDWWLAHYPDTQSFSTEKMVHTGKIFFAKEDGTCIKNLNELENDLPRGEDSAQNLKEIVSFAEPTFLHVPEMPALKINRVGFVYDVVAHEEEFTIEGDSVIQGLLLDDETGESILFYTNNEIRQISAKEEETAS